MPIYTVQLRINIPSLGERVVSFSLIDAPTIELAVAQAKTAVVVEPVSVIKTA